MNKETLNIIGIDPGNSGGAALLINGELEETVSFNDVEEIEWIHWLHAVRSEVKYPTFVIEKVHSMPGQGVSSTFKFGDNFGFLRGTVMTLFPMPTFVTPQKWQKSLGITPRRTYESKLQFKNRLRAFARRRYPYDIWEENLSSQRAVCDAILIADYMKRELTNGEIAQEIKAKSAKK